MKTFYSILYCAIRPNLDEKVSIGFFMGNEQNCRFEYSAEKLAVIKELFSESAYSSIKLHLRSLTKLSQECQNDEMHAYMGHRLLREEYFNYLSKYAQNLIVYSEPSRIDLDLTEPIFKKLFEKFIFSFPQSVEHTIKPIDQARKTLSKSIAEFVNFDIELKKDVVPGLLVPAKIWFIGKNEVQVTGESKDFNGVAHFIQQQINAHMFLIDKIRETKDGKNGHFFFIGDEPSKELKENHKLWKAVKESKILDLVPSCEIEKVEKYMFDHGVEPLFKGRN
ncbi:hypothetical protein ACXZ1K_16010 [Pedobacter sp. PWIIR3]